MKNQTGRLDEGVAEVGAQMLRFRQSSDCWVGEEGGKGKGVLMPRQMDGYCGRGGELGVDEEGKGEGKDETDGCGILNTMCG